jgi:hypothetical protein
VTRSAARSTAYLWIGLGIAWFAAVVTGLGLLAQYERDPGMAAEAHAHWPVESRLTRDPGGPTLVMLAHPRCTCTRASIAELQEVMARTERRPRTYVVFIKPGGMPGDWEQSDLWRAAVRIAGVTVMRDDDGIEAQRFGAETSGQTFLYAADGHLLFTGGTTGARGHEGDNPGRAAILSLLNQERNDLTRASVFGCSLFADGDRPQLQKALNDSDRR